MVSDSQTIVARRRIRTIQKRRYCIPSVTRGSESYFHAIQVVQLILTTLQIITRIMIMALNCSLRCSSTRWLRHYTISELAFLSQGNSGVEKHVSRAGKFLQLPKPVSPLRLVYIRGHNNSERVLTCCTSHS